MLFSTPWPLWSPVLWLCNVFFFPRLLPLSLHLVFACVLGAVSHRVGVRLAVLFLTLKLWRALFFSALCHEPVLLSWFSRARLQRPPLSGLQKNSKRVNFFLPVNLPVRRFQFKVVYIASVTVRIASECATEWATRGRWKALHGTKLLEEGTSYWWLSGEMLFLHLGNKLISSHGPLMDLPCKANRCCSPCMENYKKISGAF